MSIKQIIFWRVFILQVLTFNLDAQEIVINFRLLYGSHELQTADSSISTFERDHLKITTLRFYVTNIQFYRNQSLVLEENKSVHLVDAAKPLSQQILIINREKIAFDEIRFQLGIDSLTNVSGALGGALDPTEGMYWTWQSGYINFKLEGNSDLCSTRNHEFQFHLGGYQGAVKALQTITLPVFSNSKVEIVLDLEKLLQQINLKNNTHVMSPSAESVQLSQRVATSFKSSRP